MKVVLTMNESKLSQEITETGDILGNIQALLDSEDKLGITDVTVISAKEE